ncbi:PD-(D/E)XK nuclease family protein [Rhizobium pisi]|uniref:PD-(D/E)XK nuclease family protein n=1 Tax=Rhizobium pisi TaxID=574561 RepID=UPI0039B1093A
MIDRLTDTFYCPILGVPPSGYDTVREAEKNELDRERVRLWYVAATRARELLVLPRLDVLPSKSSWIGLVDLSLTTLPGIDASHLPFDPIVATGDVDNDQTREGFAAGASAIADRQVRLTWLAPSRDENASGEVLQDEDIYIWTGSENGADREPEAPALIQGGRERGLILHKLMEEVLTGESDEAIGALRTRAEAFIGALGKTPSDDPANGLSADELALCVTRTLALPEIAALRPALLAEFPIYTLRREVAELVATAGIADALTIDPDGRPLVVVDWKSDVNPDPQTLDHYRAQVRAYLDMTGAEQGLIVLMTSATVIHVMPSPQTMAA